MTLPRFALIAFVGSIALAAQVASADLRYGPAYDPANRIEDLAVALKNEARTDFRATRFDGSLAATASAIENHSQSILRLARSGRDQSQAIISLAGQIRRLAVRGEQQLGQVNADLVRGRGFVTGNPSQAGRILAEIDRQADYITRVAALPPQAFWNQTYRPSYGQNQQPFPGSYSPGSYGPESYGPTYDDRFGQVVPQYPQVQPNQGSWFGGRGWGVQIGR